MARRAPNMRLPSPGHVGRLLNALISVLGVTTAAALIYAAQWLNAFGPEFLANGWFATALQTGLWLGAMAIIVFGSARYFDHQIELVGSFSTLGVALLLLPELLDATVLTEHGRSTTCTVLHVRRHVEHSTDSQGHDDTRVYYDHALDCDTPRVRSITTSDKPKATPGQRITVRYDPRGRLSPLPADEASTGRVPWLIALSAIAVAALLRGLAELRGSPGYEGMFFGPLSGFVRVRLGVIAFGTGLVWLFGIFGVMHVMAEVRDHLLGVLGVTENLRRDGWVRWPTRLVNLVGSAVIMRYVISLGAKLVRRVLTVCRFLDPDGTLRGLLDGLDTDVGFTIGGLTLSFGGLPGVKAVKNLAARRTARH